MFAIPLDLSLLTNRPEVTTAALVAAPQDPTGGGAGGPADGTEGAPPSSPFGGMLVPLVLVFAIFWFVMIGPERKNRKKREAMLAALQKGDKVMTSGGMYASVAAVQDDIVTLQVADGVRMRFNRASIQTVIEDEA